MQQIEKAIEIDAPLEDVFDLFSDFENFPRWMSNIKDVHYTGRRFTRWTARAPLGTSVEWEAETIVFEPDHRIVWRTMRGDVNTNGEVIFESTRRGTTLLRVILGYDVPAGRFGALVASLFGKNPAQELEEDLRHFAEIAEGREPRDVARDDNRALRNDGRDDQAREDYMNRPAGYRRDDERNQPDARFDEALRNARRSQQDDWQRYEHKREIDLQWRRRAEDERTPQRQARTFDERSNELNEEEQRGREEQNREHQNAREPETNRYALTPRERARELEMERERRLRNVPEESRKVFRRGVDRLAEEGPSTRWRRD